MSSNNNGSVAHETAAPKKPNTSDESAIKPGPVIALIVVLLLVAVTGSGMMVYGRLGGLSAHHMKMMILTGLGCAAFGCIALVAIWLLIKDKPTNTLISINQQTDPLHGSFPKSNLEYLGPAEESETTDNLLEEISEPLKPLHASISIPEKTVTVHGQVWSQTEPVATAESHPEHATEQESGDAVVETLALAPESPITQSEELPEELMGDGQISFGKTEIGGVHTLVTLSLRDKDGNLPESSDSPPNTEVDAILFDRLDEYKLYKPDEGCVLLITQTVEPNIDTTSLVPSLNGATAALNLARTAATVHGLSTLIIDAGSLAWSKYAASDWSKGPAPDVVDLPRVPGVFDILAGKSDFDDWLMVDDESPNLSALAPGEIPADWQEALQSDAMRDLIAKARKEADVIIIYAPNIQDHPETVKALGALSNGILLVSGSGAAGAAAEQTAVAMLPQGSVILGRISLGDDVEQDTIAGSVDSEPILDNSEDDIESVESAADSNLHPQMGALTDISESPVTPIVDTSAAEPIQEVVTDRLVQAANVNSSEPSRSRTKQPAQKQKRSRSRRRAAISQ